jgi:hypothetical protein
MSRLALMCALVASFASIGAASSHDWNSHVSCAFAGGKCVRSGLVTVVALERGLKVVWWDENDKLQQWKIDEGLLKGIVTCTDGDACQFAHYPRCYLGCVLQPPFPEFFDARAQRLYFSLQAYDRRGILIGADLAGRRVSRILEDGGAGDYVFWQLQPSPSGQYLAYLRGHHGSWCDDFFRLTVYDLTNSRHVTLPGDEDPWARVHKEGIVMSDDAFQWKSDTEVAVERREWTEQSCADGSRPLKDSRWVARLFIPAANKAAAPVSGRAGER